jgi:two-component system NtrC family sensor kinase
MLSRRPEQRRVIWKSIGERVRSSLRYRLFALVMLPSLLAMLATLGFTVYWLNNFSQDNLNLKARGDVELAQQSLKQVETDRYLAPLQRLAVSDEFQAQFRRRDSAGLARALRAFAAKEGFSFVHITGELGNWLFDNTPRASNGSKPTPLTGRAMRGVSGTAMEVFSHEDLAREGPALARSTGPAVAAGVSHQLGPRTDDDRALMLRVATPVADKSGAVLAVLDGGVVLNHSVDLVNAVRDRIYGNGGMPPGGFGAVALLLDDVRVSGNILAGKGADLSGLHVSRQVSDRVLGKGDTWVTQDDFGGETYASGYAPLFDVHGQAIGMLQTSFLEAPFLHDYYWTATLLMLGLLVLFSIAAWFAFRGARRIFGPIEKMTAVVRATQAGIDRRIGDIGSRDEIHELATQFDTMLDLLQARKREIQNAAGELETKVQERTRELESKNADLETTVEQLHKTRLQLVMAEKLAAVGELAAGIAHEINNPAAVILGNLGILTTELGAAAEPVRAEIDLIMHQVERIRHIVNRLLQLARPSRAVGEIQEVDVNQAVEATLPLVRHMLEKKSVKLRLQLAAGGFIRINPYDLEEVLINLIINANHAVSPGGVIELDTADWGSRGVVITVRDNGVGIAPGALHRIFDPFFTTDPQQRSGLGLSISYGLIRRYGGTITAESEPGTGSVFQVWLLQQPAFEGGQTDANPSFVGSADAKVSLTSTTLRRQS